MERQEAAMVELKEMSEDELRARIANWMAAGGPAQLAVAALEIKRAQQELAEKFRIDRRTLCEPMTI